MRTIRRRITIPETFDAEAFKAVVKQLNDNHDYIENLQNNLDIANDRLQQQDRAMANWRKWHEDNARRLDQAEARVQQGVVESKEFIMSKLLKFDKDFPVAMEEREAAINAQIDSIAGLLVATGVQTEQFQVYLKPLHEVRP